MRLISDSNSLLKMRRNWRWIAGGLLALTLAGCLKFPLGDPAKSQLDPRLEGYWYFQSDDERSMASLYPFDAHTYVVEWTDVRKEGDDFKVRERDLYKAWLTDVKGHKFITLEPLAGRLSGADEDKKFYAMFRLDFGSGTVKATSLNDDFEPLKKAASAADVNAAVTKEVDNPQLYNETPAEFRKLDPQKDAELLKQMGGPDAASFHH